jgi:hypothetical protein
MGDDRGVDSRLRVGIHGQLRVIDTVLGRTQAIRFVGKEAVEVHSTKPGEEVTRKPAEAQQTKEKVLRTNVRLSE